MLGVVMQEGWNGLDLGKALEAETKAIAADLPLGLSLHQGHRSGGQHPPRPSTSSCSSSSWRSASCMVVSLVSLGWRVGIVVAAAVPLTLAVVFVIMLDTGRDVRPHHAGRADPLARPAGRRRHHRHRDDGGEDGGGHGPHQGRGLCLEPHGGADALRHAGHGHRPDAGRLRPVDARASMPATSSGSSASP